MSINPNIPLMVQNPNFMNTHAQAVNTAAAQNGVIRQNDLNALFQDQGPGIMQGDQNALAALSRLSPEMAMDAQNNVNENRRSDARLSISQEQLGINRQRLVLAKEAGRRQAAQIAAQTSKEQAALEAQRDRETLNMGMAIQSPEQWDQIMSARDPDLVGQFEQRDVLYAAQEGVEELLGIQAKRLGNEKKRAELNAGPAPADEYGRYVAETMAAGQKPLDRISYAQAKKGKGTVVYDPNTGNPLVEIGGNGSAPPKMTVDAAKNTGFLVRARQSQAIINDLEEQGTDFWQQAAGAMPLGLENYMRSSDFQKYDQARRDFVNTILRRESGAVISDQEFDNAEKQYFPAPGNDPEVIAQKRANREAAIEGLRLGSGEGAAYIDKQGPGPRAKRPDIPDFGAMSDEELDAYIAKTGGDK